MKYIFLVTLLTVLVSCGSKYDNGDKFRDEKDKRLETEDKLHKSESEQENLKAFLTNVTRTANYTWTWRSNTQGLDFAGAEKACQDIGYEIPDKEQLAEAEANEKLKRVMYLDMPNSPRIIYVKGEETDRSVGGLAILCVQKN